MTSIPMIPLLPADINQYIDFLVQENKHKEHTTKINQEYKYWFVREFPPIFYLKSSLKNSSVHDDFIDIYCEYIQNMG